MAASSFRLPDRSCASPATTPVVSVLVTTYNHSRFVIECLDSVRAQTFRDFEVVITDDASSDGTADVIEAWLARTGYPARFVRNRTNRGICANRNTALSLTTAPFVCSLSGDDAYEPDRLERQVRFFLQEPADVAAVYSDARVVDTAGRGLGTFLKDDREAANDDGRVFTRLLREDCFFPAAATMVRRSAVEAVGGYDTSLAYEDYDMWLRLACSFRIRRAPGTLVRYRLVPTSLSRNPAHRSAIGESHLRILISWMGHAGVDESHLWKRIGREQIALGRDREGLESLSRAALAGGRASDRAAARLMRTPGACRAARSLARLDAWLRFTCLANAVRRCLARVRGPEVRRR